MVIDNETARLQVGQAGPGADRDATSSSPPTRGRQQRDIIDRRHHAGKAARQLGGLVPSKSPGKSAMSVAAINTVQGSPTSTYQYSARGVDVQDGQTVGGGSD